LAESKRGDGAAKGQRPSAFVDEKLLATIRDVARLAREQGLAELTVCQDGVEIRVELEGCASSPVAVVTPATGTPAVVPVSEPAAEPAAVEAEPGIHVLKAPMVGVFYRAPMPESPPFVNEGDHVAPGDVVGLIEAMKIFNEVQAEAAGRIVEFLAKNEEFVSLGQPLLKLKATP